MQPITFIDPWYYSTVYYCVMLVLCWMTVIYHVGSNGQKILYSEGSPSQMMAVLLTLLIAVFVGLRPINREFGDTGGYAFFYNRTINYDPVSLKTEWLWTNLGVFCKTVLGMNVHEFFLLVDICYYGCMLICSFILMRKNLWLSMLFFFTAFQTYSFSMNGIRNGLACGMVLVAISMLATKKSHKIVVFIIMFLALCIHRSTMLPSTAALFSFYFLKDTKFAFRFWFLSIAISLVAGNIVEQFFGSLGFDDRMSKYSEGQYDEERMQQDFSHTGFRWDFLLYGVFPVIMIWYVAHYRKFKDPVFNVVANTYLLCSAFWIMVIRAAYSNRFAYLSWFIYPVVIAYPLLRMNLWKDQDRKTAFLFFAYTGFTFFMFFIYYFGTTGFKGFDQYWWR